MLKLATEIANKHHEKYGYISNLNKDKFTKRLNDKSIIEEEITMSNLKHYALVFSYDEEK